VLARFPAFRALIVAVLALLLLVLLVGAVFDLLVVGLLGLFIRGFRSILGFLRFGVDILRGSLRFRRRLFRVLVALAGILRVFLFACERVRRSEADRGGQECGEENAG